MKWMEAIVDTDTYAVFILCYELSLELYSVSNLLYQRDGT